MKQFSIFEAKAKFSAVIREALESGGITITQRGVPIVNIFPCKADNKTIEDVLKEFELSGKLKSATSSWKHYEKEKKAAKIVVNDGALARFLADRD